MIYAKGLYKNFRVYKKEPGFVGSVKSFFLRNYETNPAVADFDLDLIAQKNIRQFLRNYHQVSKATIILTSLHPIR